MGLTFHSSSIVVGSMRELDALVGAHVMEERPAIRWEDSVLGFQFDSLEEALDCVRDPLIPGFLADSTPDSIPYMSIVREVRECRPYSTSLTTAWEIVEQFDHDPLQLRREGDEWVAAFGIHPEVRCSTVPLAICLSALRAKGVEVTADLE